MRFCIFLVREIVKSESSIRDFMNSYKISSQLLQENAFVEELNLTTDDSWFDLTRNYECFTPMNSSFVNI